MTYIRDLEVFDHLVSYLECRNRIHDLGKMVDVVAPMLQNISIPRYL